MASAAFAGPALSSLHGRIHVSSFTHVYRDRRPTKLQCLPQGQKSIICVTKSRPNKSRNIKRVRSTGTASKGKDSHSPIANPKLGTEERLQKVMSRLGVASRRQSEVMISEGRVRVNGKVIREQGFSVNSRKDRIVVNGKELELRKAPVWVAVHKPRGYLSMAKEGSKRTVEYLVPKARERNVVPAGGIDLDFSGLVIMTNERGFVPELASPQNRQVKEWIVDCEGSVTNQMIAPLRSGVQLPGDSSGVASFPADIKIRGSEKVVLGGGECKTLTRLEVRVRESRHHLIRKLFEAVDVTVVRASRRGFGSILLGNLKRGDFRYLTANEINALKRGVSMSGSGPNKK